MSGFELIARVLTENSVSKVVGLGGDFFMSLKPRSGVKECGPDE